MLSTGTKIILIFTKITKNQRFRHESHLNLQSQGLSKFLLVERKEGRRKMDARERGQVDTSDAALVVIDGRKLKEKSYNSYLDLVQAFSSLYRKSNHELFARPYSNDVEGGLVAHEGEELERDDYYQSYANFAIEEFLRLRKDMKLRLVKLFRVLVNTACLLVWFSPLHDIFCFG